ncbi:glycoside hydrolase family 9 protein [Neiella sp. HB171785]|uniref:Glycoside hydrolase family 9 protein n=1 Tax=Neiella litorisoli TaxID=2771431 RepID=A0A8J6UER2_9GAMM|nr:glycoside hydrolase family 9 protein [Neiella litorisoli]MBD1388066.1 glycoside hydrolase family 9 protein [Neiella litorisoli]
MKKTALLLLALWACPWFATANFESRIISINQLGYPVHGDKIATLRSASKTPLGWRLYNLDSEQYVADGMTVPRGHDHASGVSVHHIDFSSVTKPGRYVIKCDGSPSYGFRIADDLYQQLPSDSFHYFYFHRMGAELDKTLLADPRHWRGALHTADRQISCFDDWCGDDVMLNVQGSWADAGDFGIYPVNHAISAWTLLNAYELMPQQHQDNQYAIPERGNGVPDVLDEVRFGSQYFNGLMPPEQLASHKVTNQQWSVYPLSVAHENAMERYAQPPSTAATYAVARVAAQQARVMAPFDPAFSSQQWQLAQLAWQRAEQLPQVLYTAATKDSPGGGDYPDEDVSDDRYAALAEMTITAKRLQSKHFAGFVAELKQSPHFLTFNWRGSMDWQKTQGTGTLSIIANWKELGLSQADREKAFESLIVSAETSLQTIANSGFPTPYNPVIYDTEAKWEWGSNSMVANNMIVLAYAYAISGERKYLQGVYRGWDYLLGNNALNLSFVTGYGSNAEMDTLDGHAWTQLLRGIPYPAGWLSGGPMNDPSSCVGEPMTDLSKPPARAYAPAGTASRAWCSKENTINWNAPLYWLAIFTANNPMPRQ